MRCESLLVIRNKPEDDININAALDIYETFHMLSHASWGGVPFKCTCPVCYRNCMCEHGAIFASIFNAELKVPEEYVAVEPSLRKKCRKMRGTAGPRRARLIREKVEEEKIKEQKIQFIQMQVQPKPALELSLLRLRCRLHPTMTFGCKENA